MNYERLTEGEKHEIRESARLGAMTLTRKREAQEHTKWRQEVGKRLGILPVQPRGEQ